MAVACSVCRSSSLMKKGLKLLPDHGRDCSPLVESQQLPDEEGIETPPRCACTRPGMCRSRSSSLMKKGLKRLERGGDLSERLLHVAAAP